MTRSRKVLLSCGGAAVAAALAVGVYTLAEAAWDVPQTIRYEGVLTDAAGNPVEGTKQVTFRVYDVASGGTAKWEESQSVAFGAGGVFAAELGASAEFPADLFEGGRRWLGLTVEGAGELAPRHLIHSVPYALKAGTSSGLAPGADVNAGSVTVGSGGAAHFKLNGAGVVEFGGANAAGWTSNLGIKYPPGGVFSIVSAQGADLSPTNPGWVVVPSTTAGQNVPLEVTANASFNDGRHTSSQLLGFGFGITESRPWDKDMPFFLYAGNKNNTSVGLFFFISRDPTKSETPEDAKIGDKDTVPTGTNDAQDAIFILGTVSPESDYARKPCVLIGAFRMQWVLGDRTCWQAQELGNSDGIGPDRLDKTFATTWTMPKGQNGADEGKYGSVPEGTFPIYTDRNNYFFRMGKDGVCSVLIDFRNIAGGVAGTGTGDSGVLHVAIPYKSLQYDRIGMGTAYNSGGVRAFVQCAVFESGNYISMLVDPNLSVIVGNDQNSVSRQLTLRGTYVAFGGQR